MALMASQLESTHSNTHVLRDSILFSLPSRTFKFITAELVSYVLRFDFYPELYDSLPLPQLALVVNTDPGSSDVMNVNPNRNVCHDNRVVKDIKGIDDLHFCMHTSPGSELRFCVLHLEL